MSEHAIARPELFPPGTEVTVYPVSNWSNGIVDQAAEPVGKAAKTQKVSGAKTGGGAVKFTGLKADEGYVAYAKRGDQHIYVFLTPRAAKKKG